MKRIVFTTVLAGLLGTFLYAQNNSNNTNHITSAQTASAGKDGPFVVIELKAETDLNATPRKSHIETAEEKAERDRRQGGPLLTSKRP